MRKKMKAKEVGKHLILDPEVCFGKLTFKGTRLPVETVLNWLAKGESMQAILRCWPYISREAIGEAVQLACQALLKRHPARRRDKHDHPGRAASLPKDTRAAS
jgi:uncharacterized protein (DUF433 family)